MLVDILKESIIITFSVFVIMVFVDWLNLLTKGKVGGYIKKGGVIIAALLGAMTGCSGSIFVATLYLNGMLSFGCLCACMVASCGDEQFVMLTLFPKKAIFLICLLFVLGACYGFIIDRIFKRGIVACSLIKDKKENFKEHILNHILKRHILKIFLWTFGALLATDLLQNSLNLPELIKKNMSFVLLMSGFLGIIPESGPHLIFTIMFSKGVIPFSVLLTNSIVQDGHGMLSLLHKWRDFILVKAFNLFLAFFVGFILYALRY